MSEPKYTDAQVSHLLLEVMTETWPDDDLLRRAVSDPESLSDRERQEIELFFEETPAAREVLPVVRSLRLPLAGSAPPVEFSEPADSEALARTPCLPPSRSEWSRRQRLPAHAVLQRRPKRAVWLATAASVAAVGLAVWLWSEWDSKPSDASPFASVEPQSSAQRPEVIAERDAGPRSILPTPSSLEPQGGGDRAAAPESRVAQLDSEDGLEQRATDVPSRAGDTRESDRSREPGESGTAPGSVRTVRSEARSQDGDSRPAIPIPKQRRDAEPTTRPAPAQPAERPSPPDVPRLLAAVDLPEYRRPPNAPGRPRFSSMVRSATPDLDLRALAPEHVGFSASASPSLWWWLSDPPPVDGEFLLVITDPGSVEPLLERALASPATAGLQRIALDELGLQLPRSVDLAWRVAFRARSEDPSKSLVAEGWLRCIPRDADLLQAIETAPLHERPARYAALGLWYEALASLIDLHETHPMDPSVRAALDSLLEQVDLRLPPSTF